MTAMLSRPFPSIVQAGLKEKSEWHHVAEIKIEKEIEGWMDAQDQNI
ncbi:hypothetical protein MGI18_18210 [Bacillus sp. OVS6]|nr:hypothetical protein MGI18_18210 [Bacillus sp. OVS6]